jgi:hypothetical protein
MDDKLRYAGRWDDSTEDPEEVIVLGFIWPGQRLSDIGADVERRLLARLARDHPEVRVTGPVTHSIAGERHIPEFLRSEYRMLLQRIMATGQYGQVIITRVGITSRTEETPPAH